MRFFGQMFRGELPRLGRSFFAILLCAFALPAFGQNAPQVLPYTMSTYAGPHATYSAGAACGNFVALDTAGDGCLAPNVSIGIDPHDLRVDGQGNVFYLDNTSGSGVTHKITPYQQQVTIYQGSLVNTKYCAASVDKEGDNCPANDGAANATSTLFSAPFKASRGLGVAPNGDVYIAGYNDSYDHKINAATGLLSIIAGNGTATSGATPINGNISQSEVSGTRGISADGNNNVYIADTGDNVIRLSANGQVSTLNALNTASTKAAVPSGVPFSGAILVSPEDVQIDAFGNIWIADAGDAVVRVVYEGNGTLPGISNPISGYIYTIAGYNALTGGTTVTYPSDGTTPTYPATQVAIGVRKISLDAIGNLYIADASHDIVWFVDHATGYLRLLAGHYGVTTPLGCPANPATTGVGDGCPGSFASFNDASTNAGFGTSPDNLGNLYITDPEGSSNSAGSRIRKLLSGLNFPAVTAGSTLTQNLLVHFGPNDTPSASAFTLTTTGTDFTVGAAACNPVNTDATTDCIVPITFAPTQPGYDTATLVVTSSLGGANSFLLTGAGALPTLAFDPGNVAVVTSSVKNPTGVAVDFAGNTYIADTANNRVLFQSRATGAVAPFAGGATATCSSATNSRGDGCPAISATLNGPTAITVDAAGSVYIADTGNNVIRKVSASTGIITTFAGGASQICNVANDSRGDGCPATSATFSAPSGLAADNFGQIFVSDTGNNVVRQIGTNGNVTTLAGGASAICAANVDSAGDGCGSGQILLSGPTALAFDFTGRNLFVADTGNNIVRRIALANSITVSTPTTYTVINNPVTRVAGFLSAGSSVDSNSLASQSLLNTPQGIALDAAGNLYIADTGNAAIRLVNARTGVISTIAGILTASGNTTGASAISTQLAGPRGVAVSPSGALTILDSGNNRILSDARSAISFNFGRLNPLSSSLPQNITEINIGTAAATLPAAFTSAGDTGQFTLTAAANGNSSIPACASGSFVSGAICNLQAVFTPQAIGTYSASYSQPSTGASGATPAITLVGTGAVQTKTTSTVAQTSPTGNSQFGGSATFTVNVTPAACNTAAPSCTPSGTVTFSLDGTSSAPLTLTNGTASESVSGLSVGPHMLSCNYSGDAFYSSSVCAAVTITVIQASTTSTLTATNNNQTQYDNCTTVIVPTPSGTKTTDLQCGLTNLTAKVVSSTSGSPTGTVSFYVSGSTTAIGTAPVNPQTGQATLQLSEYIGALSLALDTADFPSPQSPDTTLPPGTYTLTCTYSGATNFSSSTCAGITFTVLPQAKDFSLISFGCSASVIGGPAGNAATLAEANSGCLSSQLTFLGVPQVAVAQGSTTDVTIFIVPNNTVSGAVTITCAGLPAASTCTFNPSLPSLTATTGPLVPYPIDVTLWTDLLPGEATNSARTSTSGSLGGGGGMALMLGWPLTLLGLFGIFRLRRRPGAARGLSLLCLGLLMAGSSLLLTGCGAGGPGAYKPNLTPPGTYPIAVTVSVGGVSHTTTVYFTVTSPGIAGQE